MEEAARKLQKLTGCGAVLVKGGHLVHDPQQQQQRESPATSSATAAAAAAPAATSSSNSVVDVLYDGHRMHRLSLPRVSTGNTHGTGCTLASAIAAGLAKGLPLLEAVWQVRRKCGAFKPWLPYIDLLGFLSFIDLLPE